MISLIKELNRTSKKAPKKVRAITLYNIVNFISTLVLTAGLSIFSIIMSDEIASRDQLLMILLPLFFVAINYCVLIVNKNFIYGSIKAYWTLLILLLFQCVSFEIGDYSFELNLGGIPISFSLTLAGQVIKVNIAAIIFTGYLFNVKEEYFKYVQTIKEPTSNNK